MKKIYKILLIVGVSIYAVFYFTMNFIDDILYWNNSTEIIKFDSNNFYEMFEMKGKSECFNGYYYEMEKSDYIYTRVITERNEMEKRFKDDINIFNLLEPYDEEFFKSQYLVILPIIDYDNYEYSVFGVEITQGFNLIEISIFYNEINGKNEERYLFFLFKIPKKQTISIKINSKDEMSFFYNILSINPYFKASIGSKK